MKTTIKTVKEGWHAPGYRDPELHLITETGEIHVRLAPQAFVELHNILCAQQACIDNNKHKPLDIALYPHETDHVSSLRSPCQTLDEGRSVAELEAELRHVGVEHESTAAGLQVIDG